MSIETLLTRRGFAQGKRVKKFGFASKTPWANGEFKVETHTAMGDISVVVLFVGGLEVDSYNIKGTMGWIDAPSKLDLAEIEAKMDRWFTRRLST